MVGSWSLRPIAWAHARASPSVNSALASQAYSWCQKHHAAIGSGEASVRNTRSHGTSTSSSHSCPSSSSKRLLSGARNGFPWRAETLRQTTVTPGAATGTTKVARWPSRSTPECAPT